MVEHLLAKEDVASSSLVTRSSLRFERKIGIIGYAHEPFMWYDYKENAIKLAGRRGNRLRNPA